MKLFWLNRKEDLSGVSGKGIVAEGVIFENGQVVLRWRGRNSSIAVFVNLRQVEAVHGHKGATEIVFEDDPRLMELVYQAQREAQKWEHNARRNADFIRRFMRGESGGNVPESIAPSCPTLGNADS